MIHENKSPQPGNIGAGSRKQNLHAKNTTKSSTPRKWFRILSAFYSGRRMNRFDAEGLSDHCLHSTVSGLERRGVRILRRNETIPGYQGCATVVCRYWLDRDAENLRRVRALLDIPESDRAADASTSTKNRETVRP